MVYVDISAIKIFNYILELNYMLQIEDIKCPYVEGCLGLIEPLEDKKDDVCYTKKEQGEGTELAENLVERRPSCLDSDISSNIPSPQESEKYYFE